MKKLRVLAVIFAVIISVLCISASAASASSYDVNGDGEVSAKDLTRLMKLISGQDVTAQVSDINGDGKTDTKDLTRLMKYIAGDIGGADTEDGGFAVTGNKYTYGDEELVILELENLTDTKYNVTVTVRFYGEDGEQIRYSTQRYTGFADGFKRSFVFRPYLSFESFDYELELEEYKRACYEEKLSYEFLGFNEYTYEDESQTKITATGAAFSCTNANVKDVIFSCYYAVTDKTGTIYSMNEVYWQIEGESSSGMTFLLFDAEENPVLIPKEKYGELEIIPMIYNFVLDPASTTKNTTIETFSPVTPNRVEGQISSQSGKPDPIVTEASEPFDLVNDAIRATFTASNGVKLAYRMHLPADYSEEYAYPVLLVIHGYGFEGYDNEEHVSHSFMTDPYYDLSSPLHQCIVIYPQCPYGRFTNYSLDYRVDETPITEQMVALVELLDDVNATYSTNLNRQYVMGFSAGGFATWDLLMRFPDRFAAAIPIAGGADPTYAEVLKDTYIHVYHDTDDIQIPVESGREMFDAIKGIGGEKISYTETSGMGHVLLSMLVSKTDTSMYDWLFDKVKE